MMRSKRFWNIVPTYTRAHEGYVLIEVLFSIFIIGLIGSALLLFSRQTIMSVEKAKSSMEVMANGRYARQFIGNRIRFAQDNLTVYDAGQSLAIGAPVLWQIAFRSQQLYRKLSNGDLQPISGIGVNGKIRYVRVLSQPGKSIFEQNGNELQLRWLVQGRFGQYSVEEAVLPDIYYHGIQAPK